MFKLSDDYEIFNTCTYNKKVDFIIIILKFLLLTLPGTVRLLSLIELILYTSLKPLIANEKMVKFLYITHPVQCIITGASDCGKSYFLTCLFLNNINEVETIYIYSPSLQKYLYQRLINWFGKYLPINIIPNILNEKR